MEHKFQKPLLKSEMHIGCLNCSPVTHKLSMDRLLAVGFGDVQVSRDGEMVYSENDFRYTNNGDRGYYPIAMKFEKIANKDPDHDWRIHFYAPLHEEVYQRQGVGLWVMIESGPGFA